MLKFSILVAYCLLQTISANAQQVELMTGLNASINESSGLIFLNQKIITHNDSGGLPELYEIDSITGNINRIVQIENALNVDWEDITADDDYIYIGDFGNNAGSRTDLKIYRLTQQDFFNTSVNSASVDTIVFSYADQVDYTPTSYSTNFDAEALVAFNDSLYVFTKNWGDNWTNIYALPKTPGNYQAEKLDSINTLGLITGASVSNDGNSITLCGYAGVIPFIMELNQIDESDFSGSNILRYDIAPPGGYSVQIEGITAINDNQFYLSSEEFLTGTLSGLYKCTKKNFLSLHSNELLHISVFPNPAVSWLTIECDRNETLNIIDTFEQVVQTAQLIIGTNEIDLKKLPSGTYILCFKNGNLKKKITIVK